MFEPNSLAPAPRDENDVAPAVFVTRITRALGASAITAGTLFGMLIGLGTRNSTVWRPLNAAAHTLFGARADDVWGFQFDVTLAGCAVVLVMSAMTGFVIAELTSSGRTLLRTMATIGIVLAGYLAHVHIVARTPGGLASLLSIGELRAMYAAVAIALSIGMRYAFSPDAGATQEY